MATKDKLVNLEDLKAVYDHGTELLEEKADQTGSYPDLIAGTADNLLSSSYQTDRTPYLLRRTPYGVREKGSIVGGSIVWNQLIKNGNFADGTTGWSGSSASISASNGELTVIKNDNAPAGVGYARQLGVPLIVGHKYLATCDYKGITGKSLVLFTNSANAGMTTVIPIDENWHTKAVVFNVSSLPSVNVIFWMNYATTTADNVAKFRNICYFDLTLMFGSEIADYIYAQEQATAGAGVALAKAWAGITANYYPYDPGSIKSVTGLTAHKMTGFNQWDEEWESGGINGTNGGIYTDSTRIRSKNYISVLPNTSYYIKSPKAFNYAWYDENKQYISGNNSASPNYVRTSPNGARYLKFAIIDTAYNNDICINFSDPSKNGQYEPYTAHTYPLDSSLTLRGIPKLDGDNLYYDGDVYKADGTVERRYSVVDLGTLQWSYITTSDRNYFRTVSLTGRKTNTPVVCSKYAYGGNVYDSTMFNAQTGIYTAVNSCIVQIKDTNYTDVETFKTAMSGVYILYEVATPTTEQAEPYTALQICDLNGTEEWVGASMPVGHDTQYYADLKGKIEDIPDAPSADGTYTLKVTVSGGVATYSWG